MENKMENKVLVDKKVLVMPVRRKGSWLPPGHENEFLFGKSTFKVIVPKNQRNGELVDPLTKEERTFFESTDSGLALEKGDLSIHKKEDNFWNNFIVTLDKNVMELDLNNPMDYIRWKVLLTNKDLIAPSNDTKFSKGTYKFCLSEENAIKEAEAAKVSSKKDAYMLLGKIMDSPTKMRNFLNVYFYNKPGKKSIAPDVSKEFLQVETEKVLEKDVKGFVETLQDKGYDTKVLIYKALTASAVSREGLTFKTTEGVTIGESLDETVSYFLDPINNEEVLRIKARIDNTK